VTQEAKELPQELLGRLEQALRQELMPEQDQLLQEEA
jgi:hypothetical protein